jgi:putative FmdB family regulatory protein
MPIFEYICYHCEKVFEKFQHSAVGPKPACPHCGSEDVGRILSSFSSRFPGDGTSCTPSG